jgi:D-arabinose 1-dehydrogenase-like Zn-dependent alcohol dehydrogenase
MRSLQPEGRIVVAGATSGSEPPAELLRLAIREFAIMGSMMGTLQEFRDLCRFVEQEDLHPPISRVFDGVDGVPDALRGLAAGRPPRKLVVRI